MPKKFIPCLKHTKLKTPEGGGEGGVRERGGVGGKGKKRIEKKSPPRAQDVLCTPLAHVIFACAVQVLFSIFLSRLQMSG